MMMLLQVTREAFARYMRVIKRALTDAAVKESSRAAGVSAPSPDTPSASSSDQASGTFTTILPRFSKAAPLASATSRIRQQQHNVYWALRCLLRVVDSDIWYCISCRTTLQGSLLDVGISDACRTHTKLNLMADAMQHLFYCMLRNALNCQLA